MLCFIIIGTILSDAYAQENIIIVTEEWPPFNYSKNGELTGFSVEIVQNILKMNNEDYRIEMLPSLRSTFTLNARPNTMMFSLFRTPEREAQYKWVGPLCDGSISFYKLRDRQLKIESLADIKNVESIACRAQGLIPTLLQEQGFTNLDMTATNSLQIYKKLLSGRCDIAISDTDLGMRHYLKLLNVDPDILEKIPVKFFEAELYIACSSDIPDAEVQRWQAALDELKENGTFDKIFKMYN